MKVINSKAVVFCRVSTEEQSLDAQYQEVVNFALQDSQYKWREEDLIPIQYKESGFCLKEEERSGLKDLKRAIETNDIKCVYVWDVSRIARSRKVVSSITEYLIEKKVNLKSKCESIVLLDKESKEIPMAIIALTFYAWGAESQRNSIIAQMMRTKKVNQREGKKTLNKVRYGYATDADKRFIRNEHEADTIRQIFAMYLTGEYSCEQIAKELNNRGIEYRCTKDKRWNRKEVNRILTFKPFDGVTRATVSRDADNEKGNIYPMIVDAATIAKAIAMSKSRKNTLKASNKYNALCKGIIKDSADTLQSRELRTMSCDGVKRRYYNQITGACVSMPCIDTIAWNIAKQYRMQHQINTLEIANLDEQMQTQMQKMIAINSQIKKVEKAIDKSYNDYYVEATLSEETYRQIKSKQDAKMACLNDELSAINDEVARIKLLIKHSVNSSKITTEELESFNDDARMALIHQLIKQIVVYKESQCAARLIIKMVDDTEVNAWYHSKKHQIFINDIELVKMAI